MLKRLLSVAALVMSVLALSVPELSAATYTGCSSWRTVTNPWTGLAILPGSNQRYANINSMDLSCADLSGVDFYGAVIGGVNWSRSNLTNTNFGGTGYCGGVFTGADIAGSNLKTTSTWTCAYRVDTYVNPTTTIASTVPPTTTTTSTTAVPRTTTTTTPPPNYYCLKYGGLGTMVRWLNSRDARWGDPRNQVIPWQGVLLMTLAEWLGKSNQQKLDLAMTEVAVRPIPESGCTSLNEDLVAPTTTTTSTSIATTPEPNFSSVPSSASTIATTAPTIPRSYTTTTLARNTRTTISAPTTTAASMWRNPDTTAVKPVTKCAPTTDSLYIYSYFQSGNVTNNGGRYDAGASGFKFDYLRNCAVSAITKVLIETSYGTVTSASKSVYINFDHTISNCWRVARVSDYGQSEWSNQVCYTAPIKGAVTVKASTSVLKGVKGAQCLDGYRTRVRTKNACSSHYGRDYWLFGSFKVGYSATYKPKLSYSRFAVDTGSATGKCIGICYGVPSVVNGLPRNTYVSGYYRKDGTYVAPYTRSKR